MEFEPVIGLEVHVQLKTRTKNFTRAPYAFGAEPNTLTDPVVLGLPGTLPVLNREAIEKSVMLGLALGSSIPARCKWDRKNYFYPDNPKNYQISQKDEPICIGGTVEIELPGESQNIMGVHRRVCIDHAHLEEDVGKLNHGAGESLVDYNRAGVPLLEIVTEPDIFSSEEALAFLKALSTVLRQAGISDCDMEKGQLRCDANVSIRPKGVAKLGTRTEMKNLNSMTGVKNAIDFEVRRQTRVLRDGGEVVQETRRWDAAAGSSYSMRSKEEAHDYRYFPDPDLMPVRVPAEVVERLRKRLPELPFDRQRRYQEQLGLPYTLTSVLCADLPLCTYFETALAELPGKPKEIANLVANDLLRELAAAGVEGEGAMPLERCPIKPVNVAELVRLTEEGVITKQIGKEVFTEMFRTGEAPAAIVDRKGLRQSNDTGAIEEACKAVVADPANAKTLEQVRGGNDKAINALKGQVMKRTQGKANPAVVDDLLRRLISQ